MGLEIPPPPPPILDFDAILEIMLGYGTCSILYLEKFKEMTMSKKISPLSWSFMSSGDDDGIGRRALPLHPGLRLVQGDSSRL